MEGSTLETARPIGKVLEPGSGNVFDNGYAGISSIYRWKGKLLAFYHAEDHVAMQRIEYNTDIPGFYGSVGLAVSIDGRTFRKVGQILSANLKKGESKESSQGLGDVCVCPDHTKTYLYAYFTDWTRYNNRPVLICMARCKISDGGMPGKWYKYFQNGFGEGGLGGKDSPIMEPPKGIRGDTWAPHVTYSKTLKKYLMFFTVTGYSDQNEEKPSQTGVYFSCSDDGIKWCNPSVVFLMHCIPYKGREIVMHPGFYPRIESTNKVFGWLIYGYSARFGGPPMEPHHLARRPITITPSK